MGSKIHPEPGSQAEVNFATLRSVLLFHFFMCRMFPARITELLRFEPLAVFLLVLGSRVVSVFAIVTLQCDDFAHSRYSIISATAPAPTVWPPSRIANRSPFS
ncbi:MAG TPA: hypothetical protein VJS43_14440, partial [Candidatus Acidoferrales bacterium]|nr:hypothetical protein [Candidatus Acidoferrales bacterium]